MVSTQKFGGAWKGTDAVPRVATVLASLLLIASAIGVNVGRYPVVWEMVGGLEAGNVGTDHQGPESAVGAAPQTPEPPAVAAQRQGPPDGCQAQSDLQASPGESAPPQPQLLREPPAAEKPLAVPESSPPTPNLAGLRPLVPVILSGLEQGPPDPRDAPSAADGQVRRLPPPDRAGPRPLAAIRAPGDRSVPLSYPSTGL
jgi:hypothetical protein